MHGTHGAYTQHVWPKIRYTSHSSLRKTSTTSFPIQLEKLIPLPLYGDFFRRIFITWVWHLRGLQFTQFVFTIVGSTLNCIVHCCVCINLYYLCVIYAILFNEISGKPVCVWVVLRTMWTVWPFVVTLKMRQSYWKNTTDNHTALPPDSRLCKYRSHYLSYFVTAQLNNLLLTFCNLQFLQCFSFYIMNHNVFIKVLNRNLFPLVLRTGTSTVKMPGNQQNICQFHYWETSST